MDAIIYGLPCDGSLEIPNTKFLSSFWLHCQADNINGYDLCLANIYTFSRALRNHAFLTKLYLMDGNEYDGIVFPFSYCNKASGLICLCDDITGINHALFEYIGLNKVHMLLYDDEEAFLERNYPKVNKIITKYLIS